MLKRHDRFSIREASQEETNQISSNLAAFNRSAQPDISFLQRRSLKLACHDQYGRLIGGLLGTIQPWSVLTIEVMWVAREAQGKRIGSELLAEAEREAAAAGCTLIRLETFDFQAKDFYLKNGYSVFGELHDSPKGHIEYFLYKRIIQA